jgi:uncharacterized membrane protein YraQ (UPF0718 family)
MGNLAGAAALWALALVLGGWAARKPGGLSRKAAILAAGQFVRIMPRIAFALLVAGFVGKLIPGELVGAILGPETGARGILIASVIGGFTPGGPMISFPTVVVLSEAGAGVPQLVAFLTAWSVFAFHRVLVYESALMGWRFSAVRLVSSLALPPLAGFTAALLLEAFGISASL